MTDLWQEFSNLELKPETRQAAESLRSWLPESELAAARVLMQRAEQSISPQQMRDLEHAILRRFGRVDGQYPHLIALSHLVNIGNNAQLFAIPPCRIPVVLTPDPSPFQRERVLENHSAREWRDVLSRSVESGARLGEREAIGAILVSAALNGGIADTAVLRSLFLKISDPISVAGGRSYIELSLRWRGQDDMEQRRWFPDSLSEILLLRMDGASITCCKERIARGEIKTADLWWYIAGWFRKMGLPKHARPGNATEFFAVADSSNNFAMPLNLAAYRSRKFVSHSLHPRVWARLNAVASDSTERRTSAGIAKPLPSYAGAEDEPELYESGQWAQPLWEALRGNDKARVGSQLRKILSPDTPALDPAASLLAEWAYFLCTQKSIAGNRLTIKTIQQYVKQAGRRLAGLTDFERILAMDDESLGEVYAEVLDDAETLGQRRKLRSALCEFHHFLCERHGANPAVSQNSLGSASLAPVDANLMSFDEYEATLEQLRNSDLDLKHPDVPLIAELIVTLGFRCGLRRRELLMLRLIDIHSVGRPEAIIRPHVDRQLKTTNARRKLPLHALLTDSELARLLAWMERREARVASNPNDRGYLFSIPEMGYSVIPEDTIMPIVHHAMRQVTGDGLLRFHHLRHSFASWSALRLLLANGGCDIKLFLNQPHTYQALCESSEFAARLYGTSSRSRGHLYAVASLLGHSGPAITLEHYIHTLDLAALMLDRRPSELKQKLLVSASGISVSSAYRIMANQGMDGLLTRLRNDHPERVSILAAANPSVSTRAEPEYDDDSPRRAIDQLQKYLHLRSTTDKSQAELAERFGYTIEQCDAYEDRATHIRDLTSNELKVSPRHRFKILRTREPSVEAKRLMCPVVPRTALSKTVVEQLSPKLWSLMKTDPPGVSEVLDDFVERAWHTGSELVFHDPKAPVKAIRYLEFLRGLGFSRDSIGFVSFDTRQRSAHVAEWRRLLGLSWREKIVRRTPPNNGSEAVRGWLGIRPKFDIGPETRLDDSMAGFRYLMVMAAIYWYAR